MALTNDSHFNFGDVLAVFVDGCDGVRSGIFALGFVVEELGVVRYIFDAARAGLLNHFAGEGPGNIRSRLADDLDVEAERFAFLDRYAAQVLAVDLRCH